MTIPAYRSFKEERLTGGHKESRERVMRQLNGHRSYQASVCRTFKVPRSTLIDTLRRIGWTGPGKKDAPDTSH